MTNPTPLDEAVDKLLFGDTMAGMIELIRVFSMEDVPFSRGHAASLAKNHSPAALHQALCQTHLAHRLGLSFNPSAPIGNWSEYVAKILANSKLETVGEPAWPTAAKASAYAYFKKNTSCSEKDIKAAVNQAPDALGLAQIIAATFPKLGAERGEGDHE